MVWNDVMVRLLRSLIGDDGAVSEYADARLEELLLTSAYMMLSEVNFTNTYTVDLDDGTIVPDPVDNNDNLFINLVVLKAAFMLFSAEYRLASNKSLIVKDGPSSIDGTAIAQQKKLLVDNAKKNLDQALLEYRAGNYAAAGEAIIGPHRAGVLYANDYTNTRLWR